jgi:predicted nuclease of restriction endonuclease-like (RecB) superfamily
MDRQEVSAADCIARIREILLSARHTALRSVNAVMVAAYWQVGREIVEEEQRGDRRAPYGAALLKGLAEVLTKEFGEGFGERNLRHMRQFYLIYADRRPAIGNTVRSGLPEAGGAAEIRNTLRSESGESLPTGRLSPPTNVSPDAVSGFLTDLSWSHYRLLMRVGDAQARGFYEVECAKARWSVRELERQVSSLLFERLARSRDRESVMALAREGHDIHTPSDLVKDPYVLEFVGLPESSRWLESDLEAALIDRLQEFLLELGRDLFFVGRQKRVTIDGDHFYIDLVFYHRALRCFVLVDLKVGRLTQQDIGQMLLYTGYVGEKETREDENPPIGIILCTDKNEAVVRYTLSRSANQVFASRYQLHLPSEEELAAEIQREREAVEAALSEENARGEEA